MTISVIGKIMKTDFNHKLKNNNHEKRNNTGKFPNQLRTKKSS